METNFEYPNPFLGKLFLKLTPPPPNQGKNQKLEKVIPVLKIRTDREYIPTNLTNRGRQTVGHPYKPYVL